MGVPMIYGAAGGLGRRAQISQLWTNSDPTTSFAAQTVTLAGSLADFDLFRIAFVFSTGSQILEERSFLVSNLLTEGFTAALRIGGSVNNRTGARTFSMPAADTVSFDACTYNTGTDNSYVIPVAIYGIKL